MTRGTIRLAALATLAWLAGAPAPAQQPTTAATAVIHADRPGSRYDRRIFTQFAEQLGEGIYGGLWVGRDSPIPNTRGFRNDVVTALRDLAVPVIRWPGGCFADKYHWRDGIGPQEARPARTDVWTKAADNNAVGTHEFMDLAEQIGAQVYISVNVGSGTVQEAADWMEYMTASTGALAAERARNGHPAPWKVPYVGVGNELWGCGGDMLPEQAAYLTRQFGSFLSGRVRIASGPGQAQDPGNAEDFVWTDTMMKLAGPKVEALSLHYYTMPDNWPPRTPSIGFGEEGWATTLAAAYRIDGIIARHAAIMDRHDPRKRVWLAVDEWGSWYATDKGRPWGTLRQQNTLRDALVAAIHLNSFAAHADRVKMTAIAQMVNVLQAMILTDRGTMVLTPTYHVFAMYKPFMDATVLPMDVQAAQYRFGEAAMPGISAAAVRGADGRIHMALANSDPNRAVPIDVAVEGAAATRVAGRVLTASAMDARNTADGPDMIAPRPFTAARLANGRVTATLPAKSLVMLELR